MQLLLFARQAAAQPAGVDPSGAGEKNTPISLPGQSHQPFTKLGTEPLGDG